MLNPFQQRLKKLIERAGGVVQNTFVTVPGCMLWSATEPLADAVALMHDLGIDTSQPTDVQCAEFDARLTYLSFPKEAKDGRDFVEGVSQKAHTSIFGRTFVTMLVAGVSIETELELISHPWDKDARLTSSDTKAMDQCLYRVSGEEVALQVRALNAIEDVLNREEFHVLSQYIRNRLKPCAKALVLTIGMTLTEWNWVFGSRLQREGNEPEVLEIMERLCAILHERYPLIIQTVAAYRGEQEIQ